MTSQRSKVLYYCQECGDCAQFMHHVTLIERKEGIICRVNCDCGTLVDVPLNRVDSLQRLLLKGAEFKQTA